MSVIAAAAASVRLIDQPHEFAEEIKRVMRPGGGLRMVLHRDQRLAAMAKTFQRLIVEIDVRELHVVLAERIRIDGEAVILRSDLHASAAEVLDRMVAA